MLDKKNDSPIGDALAWASRIMAIGLTMFLPGLFGSWLDKRCSVQFLGPVGFVLGLTLSLIWLIQIGGKSRNHSQR